MKAKLGEFWYYSLLIFVAHRFADFINMFVGLWLVPKYIDFSELGAVLPLASFATVFALPIYVFALTFMKEVNTLATEREFGKMKTLMSGVFFSSLLFLAFAILLSRLLMPFFLEKIRIAEGSLGIVIFASAFLGCVAPIFTNALQALKKFSELAILQIVTTPLRLITMLVAMPFRPLSGYFVGQSAIPGSQILGALFFLRKELSVKAEKYWEVKTVRRLALIFLGMLAYQLPTMIVSLIDSTVLREHLSELDSAAYYLVTRFSDISNYITISLITVLFPMTAEAAERGETTRPLVMKALIAQVAFSMLLALFFAFFGHLPFKFIPNGEMYLGYAKFIPLLIGVNLMSSVQLLYTNTEASANRWSFLRWWLPIHFILPGVLLLAAKLNLVDSFLSFVIYLALAQGVRFCFSAWKLFKA